MDTSYEWMCEGVKVGVSSPVLYVNKPGVYQCQVTNTDGSSISTRKSDVLPGIRTTTKGINCVSIIFLVLSPIPHR